MTERLYYTDSYLSQFDATVVGVDVAAKRVTLDRTAFYPTSGGQPHDLGTLAQSAVLDVIDENDRIDHVVESVEGFVAGQSVSGAIDRVRRFDLMQQHTGQHLLSALCADVYGWPTVSVHFGDVYCTVDVDASSVGMDRLRELELLANDRITEDRPVSVSFEDAATATGLRKPSDRSGALRVVTIEGLDRSACGGTHVRRTGEIGAMLLRRADRSKDGVRIEFLCGTRAIQRASRDAQLLSSAARALSAAPEELPALVEAQYARLVESDRERKRLTHELARHEGRARWESSVPDASGLRRIRIDTGLASVRDAEPLAQATIAHGGCIVLATGGVPPGIILAAAEDTGLNAGALLKPALVAVGGRGGGSARVAQGSVADAAAAATVATALGF